MTSFYWRLMSNARIIRSTSSRFNWLLDRVLLGAPASRSGRSTSISASARRAWRGTPRSGCWSRASPTTPRSCWSWSAEPTRRHTAPARSAPPEARITPAPGGARAGSRNPRPGSGTTHVSIPAGAQGQGGGAPRPFSRPAPAPRVPRRTIASVHPPLTPRRQDAPQPDVVRCPAVPPPGRACPPARGLPP